MNVNVMLDELCRAVYGSVWARSSCPEQAWSDLLGKVADLSARSKAGAPEFTPPAGGRVAGVPPWQAGRLLDQGST